jgi:hypothetical protein
VTVLDDPLHAIAAFDHSRPVVEADHDAGVFVVTLKFVPFPLSQLHGARPLHVYRLGLLLPECSEAPRPGR